MGGSRKEEKNVRETALGGGTIEFNKNKAGKGNRLKQ